MIINTNVSSLTAQEASKNTGNSISSSLEKLSTGLKINKASDDASGLAIADKLRTQVTSINQGVSNGNSAVALLQIADKSMAEQSNILDTVKAKLIQANTDTTSADGREAIRKDIAKLLEQLDNIAEQTNYNGNVLLQSSSINQGSSSGLAFQVGETDQDIIKNTSVQSNTQGLGLADAEEHTIAITAENNQNYKLEIDGIQVNYVSDSTATIDEIHAGLKAAIEANPATAALVTVGNQTTSGDANLVLTAVNSNESFSVSSASGVDTTKLTSEAAVPATAGEHTTGAIAAFTTAGDTTSITIDGLQISVKEGDNITGAGALTSTSTAAEVADEVIAQINADPTLSAKYTASGDETGIIITAKAGFDDPVVTEVTDRAGSSALGTLSAGTKETTAVDITAADNTEYKLTVGTESISYTTKTGESLSDIHAGLKAAIEANATISANYSVVDYDSGNTDLFQLTANFVNTDTPNMTNMSRAANTNLVDSTTVAAGEGSSLAKLKDLTTLTKADAESFQAVVDAAITDLNGYRGDIGSTQNQVESAVRNLMTQSTNLSAAESIIRDVDYAEESANFNKQNIISQAGSYAISQANTVQQNVLKLLQ